VSDGYDVTDVADLDAEGPGGMARKVRRALGARAFGVNYFVFPANQAGREHHHAESGQEEVYFVVRGSGVMHVGGAEVELRPGRFVRVDGAVTRLPVSGPEGLEYLVVGAPLEGGYEPPPWG
jgi:mannose-6-phosphate isomerase-like protein (cupin superfamily)